MQVWPTGRAALHREQYAHGGMSSGMISLEAWRQRLMPMLLEQAGTRCRAGRGSRAQVTRARDL